ncbi:flavonol synthase/flavanone 3-hydroxylase-like [Capsicum chacoense]
MENLVSSWAKNVDTLTENYVMPPSKRPSEHVSIASSIPVIDLAKASSSTINHAGLVQELLNASQEFGIFQIINHGVFEKLMDDLMDLFKELFDMSVEEKEELCSGGSSKTCKLYVNIVEYEDVGADRCRTGSRIRERVVQKPSPDGKPLPALSRPKSAMGVPPHCNPNIVTFIQQQVYGLEILKDGHWIGVHSLPYTFVVILGYQLQSTFVAPPGDYIVEPMKAPVNGDSPARFWAFKFKEFLDDFVQKDSQKTLDAYKLQP